MESDLHRWGSRARTLGRVLLTLALWVGLTVLLFYAGKLMLSAILGSGQQAWDTPVAELMAILLDILFVASLLVLWWLGRWLPWIRVAMMDAGKWLLARLF